jgi:Zn-dependent protease with chaperone function
MHKIIRSSLVLLCLSMLSIAARDVDNCYLHELKAFKKSPDHEFMFDEDADPGLASIQKSIEIYKDLTLLQRLARFMFLMLDPVIVTASTMPQLYEYVDSVCKKASITTPTIFITSDKHGFFNAAAAKLFATSGGIIIGQKMIYETSQLELEAVIAHEIGHIKHNHVNKILAMQFCCYFGTSILAEIAVESYRAATNTSKYQYTEDQEFVRNWLPVIAVIFGPDLIINKRFEKEADFFAFENGRAQGIADLFQYVLDRETKHDHDFDIIYNKLQENKSKLDNADYIRLMIRYYLVKGGNYFSKFIQYIYHFTPLGAHPSHEARIQAAQDYLAEQSDWDTQID